MVGALLMTESCETFSVYVLVKGLLSSLNEISLFIFVSLNLLNYLNSNSIASKTDNSLNICLDACVFVRNVNVSLLLIKKYFTPGERALA